MDKARIVRALLSIGVPYADVCQMPLDMALALLIDGRPQNSRPDQHKHFSHTPAPAEGAKRRVATRRKSREVAHGS